MILFKMLRRFFTKNKPNKLGRWQISDAAVQHRKVDLANCDSCGTCTIPEPIDDMTEEELYMHVELGVIPIGSFDLNSKPNQLN